MRKQLCTCLLCLMLAVSGCRVGQVDGQHQPTEDAEDLPAASMPVPPESEEITSVRLACSLGDTLNPYTMKTDLNRQLIPLLYDSLVVVDGQFAPQNLLAAEIRNEGTSCVVRLREDTLFLDGTRLTPQDVAYTVQVATAATWWVPQLENVAACYPGEGNTVIFQLRREDADFPSLLTFPIVKDQTATQEFPTGVSRFYVSGAQGSQVELKPNPIYFDPGGRIESVQLQAISGEDALEFSLRMDEVDLVYSDLSTAEISSLSSGNKPVALPNLVFLGMNSNSGLLARPEFRHALSLALNRNELAVTAYGGRANPTNFPYHPYFYRAQALNLSTPRSLGEAERLLDGLEIFERDADDYRLQNGRPVSLRLLVNNENSYRMAAATLVADQLKEAGIRVEVVSKTFEHYQAALRTLDFDLYIGEVRLASNMEISQLLGGGALAYGTAYNEELAQRYSAYRTTGEGLGAFNETFAAQSPFIPLVFRQGMILIGREFDVSMMATEQNLFYNLTEW